MTYLTNDLLIKHSISDKADQCAKKIMHDVDEIFANNDAKNIALERYELIFSEAPCDIGVLEIYTYMALIRLTKHSKLKFALVSVLDPSYLERFTFLEFDYYSYRVILTVFNKLLFLHSDGKPLFLIDDPQYVKSILCKIMFEYEVRKVSNKLSDKEAAIYPLEVVPDIIYFESQHLLDNQQSIVDICFV